ncbi:hypothetical protein N7532_002249 [Penicillium argentinense]|uniref:Uncharacterized protein n=1 Tax=Penicillium argentinense TaxID=1131581 RepID=A0A9W9KK42_9EURO|nr:uncharacterized protein N7532_002249 [Penicillium argentinense]KAJ5109604.1 hypothetical protein N7532_002249 [Penicillium argentinense]
MQHLDLFGEGVQAWTSLGTLMPPSSLLQATPPILTESEYLSATPFLDHVAWHDRAKDKTMRALSGKLHRCPLRCRPPKWMDSIRAGETFARDKNKTTSFPSEPAESMGIE